MQYLWYKEINIKEIFIMKNVTIKIGGRSIGCLVEALREQSVLLQPRGKNSFFKGKAKILVSKSKIDRDGNLNVKL